MATSTTDAKPTFLLTGCASGIGRHLTGVLAGTGHRVLATDVDEAALAQRAEEDRWPADRVHRRRLDVRNENEWPGIIAEADRLLGGIDVLGNIAGVLHAEWVREPDPQMVHAHVDVNLKGVIFGTQEGARYMTGRGRGHIINFASMAGRVAVKGLAVYCATKYGVRAFSLASAAELRPFGVHVTAVCPEAVDTPLIARQRGRAPAAMMFMSPRVLSVEQIADVVTRRVLAKKPLVVYIPRRTGWLATFLDVFPGAGHWLASVVEKRGQRHRHDTPAAESTTKS